MEERRLAFAKQLEDGKRERERQSQLKKAERAKRAKDSQHLSPTSSRAVAQRKSGSSADESGSGGEVERKKAPKGSQAQKDKGVRG